MIGYQYSDDYRLIGPVPLASNPRKYGEYLVPANCTTIAPPSDYGQELEPAFNEATQEWELIKSVYQLNLEESYKESVSPTGSPLYEQNIDGDWVERDPAIVQAEDDQKNLEQNYANEVNRLKKLMDETIVEKAEEITKGTSIASVQAFLNAFQLRANAPSEYVNEGLIVRWAIDTYQLGDPLDTVEKIQTYYTKVLVYMDKFREAEITKYITAVSALPTP